MIHAPYVLVNLQSRLLHFGKGLENSHHHIADLSSQEEHRFYKLSIAHSNSLFVTAYKINEFVYLQHPLLEMHELQSGPVHPDRQLKNKQTNKQTKKQTNKQTNKKPTTSSKSIL